MSYKTKNSQSAFSLLEIAIVLIILSVSTSTFFLFLADKSQKSRSDLNTEKIEALNEAITDFYIRTGYLPCPARLNAQTETANFGVSTDCNLAAVSGVADYNAGLNSIRNGAVPVRSMGLQDDDAFDAYGNRFTYSVIRNFAINASIFDSTIPSPSAMDAYIYWSASGIYTSIVNMSAPNSYAYFLISHGPNGNGATNYSGIAASCNYSFVDAYNCDYSNNYFIDGIAVPEQFDDLVKWKTKQQLKYDRVDKLNLANITSQTYGRYALFTHTVASGSASYGTGGSSGTYYQRNLNSVQVNNLSSAYLSGNSIILGPGTYIVKATGAACGVNRNLMEIFSTTSSSVLASGMAGYSDSSPFPTDCRNAYLIGVFTLIRPETIILRHYVQTANATDGFGRSVNIGFDHKYTNLEIWEM